MRKDTFFLALAIMLILLASMPAFSKDDKSIHACDKHLTNMLSTLNDLEALVPIVPPEEAVYLEQEYNAAYKANSMPRIGAVIRRPYYYAWNLHNEFAIARDEVQRSQTLPAVLGLKMRIQMASRIPLKISDAKAAWDDYDKADNGKILTDKQIENSAARIEAMTGEPGFYIWCLSDLLDDPK